MIPTTEVCKALDVLTRELFCPRMDSRIQMTIWQIQPYFPKRVVAFLVLLPKDRIEAGLWMLWGFPQLSAPLHVDDPCAYRSQRHLVWVVVSEIERAKTCLDSAIRRQFYYWSEEEGRV